MKNPWLIISIFIYLALSLLRGATWEHMHDEAWSYVVSVGEARIQPWPVEPVAIEEIYAQLDGDETLTAGDVIDRTTGMGAFNPPAYYLLLHGWVKLAGMHRVIVRVPNYLLGLLALVGVFHLARRLAPEKGSDRWATLFLALSPWFHTISNFQRPYAMLFCVSILSTLSAVTLFDAGRARFMRRAGFVILSVIGLYTIYHYAFVLAWHLALLLVLGWRSGRRLEELVKLALMVSFILLGFAPWFPRMLEHMALAADRGEIYFAGMVALSDWPARLVHLVQSFLLIEGLFTLRDSLFDVFQTVLIVLELMTLGLLGWLLFKSRRSRPAGEARWAWWLFLLVPGLIVLTDLLNETHTLFITKTCPVILPLLLILIVRAWLTLPKSKLQILGLALWTLLFGAGMATTIHAYGTTQNGNQKVAEYLGRPSDETHLAVLSLAKAGVVHPLMLTLRDEGVQGCHVTFAPPGELAGLVETLHENQKYDRICLIQLELVYQIREPIWDNTLIREVGLQAREWGWTVRLLHAGGLEASVKPGERVLIIARPNRLTRRVPE